MPDWSDVTRDDVERTAILGTAYELAIGKRLASDDFEGGKTGAVHVLETLGFTVRKKA
jgi:hypothetical protein